MNDKNVKGGCGHSAAEVEQSAGIVGVCMILIAAVLFAALLIG
jgi:hypothetical protein